MADWYEVYDAETVQQRTRRQVSRLVTFAVGGLAVALALGPLLVLYARSPVLGLVALFVCLALLLGTTTHRLAHIRRQVWCVKLSVHRLVGYDYARRRVEIPWTEVERVEVNRDGLLVVSVPTRGRSGPVLHISTEFPDYTDLSHRVVDYAEAHGLPVCVAGRPWQLVDLAVLYPFMASVPICERPSSGGADVR